MTKNITFILCIFYNKHFFKKVKQNKERSALLDNNPILMGQSKRSLRMNVKIKIVPSVSSSKPSKERDYFYTTETAQSLPDTWVFLPNHHQFPFFSPSRWLLSSCRIGSNCDLRTTPRPMAASQDIQILKNTDVLQELKVSSHASCFLGPLPSASGLQLLYVAPPPASHAWVGPRIGVEQLRKIKVPQQAETITRAASTLAKGRVLFAKPPDGWPRCQLDRLRRQFGSHPGKNACVSANKSAGGESTGFSPMLVQTVLCALLVLEIPWCEQLQTMKIGAMDFLSLLLPLTCWEIISKINSPISNYSQHENCW